jgi:hypothetical protein
MEAELATEEIELAGFELLLTTAALLITAALLTDFELLTLLELLDEDSGSETQAAKLAAIRISPAILTIGLKCTGRIKQCL